MPYLPDQSPSPPPPPPLPPPPPRRHILTMIPSHCRNCWRNLQFKNKGRKEGRREGGLKEYFHRGYHQNRARNGVHQATCRAKQVIAKKSAGAQLVRAKTYWGTAI